MKDGTYHKAVGFPKGLTLAPVFNLTAGIHAREQAHARNVAKIPSHFLPRLADVIEIEMKAGKIVKILARQALDNLRDLCFVFLPEEKFIKTLWTNEVTDKHFTLDKSKFIKP